MNELRERLGRTRLVAILRGIRPDESETIAEVLLEAGFELLEVPLNSPDPFDSIGRIARVCGSRALVGAGTVLDAGLVPRIADAGGRLVVMPHSDRAVVEAAKRAGMFALPGTATITEAFAMLGAGADALKLFPADALGTATLTGWRAVLPAGTLVLPVGGVSPETIPAWQAAGAGGYGIGSALYRPGATPDEVAERARRFVEAARSG